MEALKKTHGLNIDNTIRENTYASVSPSCYEFVRGTAFSSRLRHVIITGKSDAADRLAQANTAAKNVPT